MVRGEKVNLRALKIGDAERILEWVNNPELRYFTGTVYPISEVEHAKWFESKLSDKVNKIFGIEEKSSSTLIGVIGFKNTDLINRSTEIYVYIGNADSWGRGFGTDAVQSLINFSFQELNIHRVALTVFSYNKRAIKSYEKVGFVTEGVMRESLYKEGKYHDTVLMAIINNM